MTTARRLLLAFTLTVGAALAHGAAPVAAQLATERLSAAVDDGDGGGRTGPARPCRFGTKILCEKTDEKKCVLWGVRRTFSFSVTNLGMDYEEYCMSEVTLTKYYYLDP